MTTFRYFGPKTKEYANEGDYRDIKDLITDVVLDSVGNEIQQIELQPGDGTRYRIIIGNVNGDILLCYLNQMRCVLQSSDFIVLTDLSDMGITNEFTQCILADLYNMLRKNVSHFYDWENAKPNIEA